PYLLFPHTHTPPPYTLSLHDALPIWSMAWRAAVRRLERQRGDREGRRRTLLPTPVHARTSPDRGRGLVGTLRLLELALFPACNGDRKSTRLNSSHVSISYAVFCLKKK